jgi:hypothetical protein
MTDNILFAYQNTITISPILLGSLVFLLIATDTYKHELLLVFYLVTIGICVGLIGYGYLELSIGLITLESIIATIYAIFRKRS